MKKNQMTRMVKDIMVGGIGLGAGSMAMGKIANIGGNNVAPIAANAQSAFRLGSVALPIRAATGLMSAMDDMTRMGQKKRKR